MSNFSQAEKVDFLFKRAFNKPTTSSSLPFYSEPSIDARDRVFPNQIFADLVPVTRPATGWDTGTSDTSLSNYIASMSDGDVLNHSVYSLQYVHRKIMSQVTPGNNQSYTLIENNENLLINMIPFNFDPAGGYAATLFDSSGDQIFDGTGEFVIANGVLTFFDYNAVSSIVSPTQRPKLSFFRYTGTIGLTEFTSLWESGTNEIYHIDKSVCIGRTTRSTTDVDLEVEGNIKTHNSVICEDFICRSDARLKTKIHKIENCMQKLFQINGYVYNWVDTNEPSMGVLAQEMQRAIPSSVQTIEYKQQNKQIKDIKHVKYNQITALLVECVKQQQDQIKTLTERLEQVENNVYFQK